MKRKDLESWIVVIHNRGELTEILNELEIKDIPKVENFPLIIYEGLNESIELSEIKQDDLAKLQTERLETKVVWNYKSIKSGLAESMKTK